MKSVIFFLVIAFILKSGEVFSQSSDLVTEGKIIYEKRINKYALIEKTLKFYPESMNDAYLNYKNTHSQFLVLKSSLSFKGQTSLFEPQPESGERGENFWNGAKISEQINTVFSDFNTKKTITEKNVKGDYFLVEDSLRRIIWKITDETREIAGFQTRRANGLVLDSIYVVAFYTNQIPLEGGPESFSGLPGMILGLSLPYENITFFATDIIKETQKQIIAPTKGKSITYQNLKDLLEKRFSNMSGLKALEFKHLLL